MKRPSLGTSLSMQAQQQLSLAPRMLQSIEVLQLAATDLESWLAEQAEANEALCLDNPPVPERRGSREDSDAHDEMLRNQPDRPRSLSTAVEEQLAGLDLDGLRLEWLRYLVSCLDSRGFLEASDEDLLAGAEETGLAGGASALGLAIADLQTLEPRGLGARNAIEALLLQLEPADPDYSLLCRLLEDFVEELARNKMPQVARSMGLELDELDRLLSILGELDSRPAADLASEGAPLLRPDVLVLPDEQGGFSVELCRGALPAVSIDADLSSIAKDKAIDAEARRYARQKVDGARAIVDAVRQRGETLLRVAQAVFAHQREYLERGPGHLRPLSMTDLAADLELHVSTVSRCVAGKHAQTPWGIEPLRSFFQVAVGDEGTARNDLREVVRRIFAEEDKRKPLSDDDAVALLATQGYELARRTVAKYRRELGIESSYRRRQF